MIRRPIRVVLIVAALVGASCSSDQTRSVGAADTSAVATDAPSTSARSSSTPPTAVSTSTAAPTTSPPTTAAPTTLAPTTAAPTTAAGPIGWSPYDATLVTAPMAMPCCGDSWYATVPSPALPAPGQPLADGDYRVEGSWSNDPTAPLQLTVRRFERCEQLPIGSCELDPPYGDRDFGVDESSSYRLTLPLDRQLKVVLSGIAAADGDPDISWKSVTASASGADLAELAGAVDAAYETAIATPIRAGADPWSVLDGLAANPVDRWTPAPPGSGVLTYVYGSAPPLLLQAPVDRGADTIGLISIHVEGGTIMLITYAGFYS